MRRTERERACGVARRLVEASTVALERRAGEREEAVEARLGRCAGVGLIEELRCALAVPGAPLEARESEQHDGIRAACVALGVPLACLRILTAEKREIRSERRDHLTVVRQHHAVPLDRLDHGLAVVEAVEAEVEGRAVPVRAHPGTRDRERSIERFVGEPQILEAPPRSARSTYRAATFSQSSHVPSRSASARIASMRRSRSVRSSGIGASICGASPSSTASWVVVGEGAFARGHSKAAIVASPMTPRIASVWMRVMGEGRCEM